ncbi:dienelactone hydrolase family protein [Marinicrinis lubricantis]|uniref:Dienelactone hydrolase family protein n=1 Tax=Marinicrinis lubricantis TaxID=2086470 RepID=A0ABW1IJI1_9BACL
MNVLDAYLEDLYEAHKTGHLLNQSMEFAERAYLLKQTLQQKLGDFPDLGGPLEASVLERHECGEYARELVEYRTDRNLRIRTYVLIPADLSGPAPAVLACHGHGYGHNEAVGLNEDGSSESDRPSGHKHFALQLVRQGFVVFVPELAGFGQRRLDRDRVKGPREANSCFALSAHLLMYGKTLAGLRVFEARRTLDYLFTRSEVDTERIGIMGFSGGGMVAAFTAALDERVRAAVICGYTSTFLGSILRTNHCIDNYVPGLLTAAEMPELIGLIAPRPLLIDSGSHDPLFPRDHVHMAKHVLEEIYTEQSAMDRLDFHLFDGVHEIGDGMPYAWLKEKLT